MKKLPTLALSLLVLALLLFGGGPLAHAATFTVNSAADAVDASPGACTLHATIMEANAP